MKIIAKKDKDNFIVSMSKSEWGRCSGISMNYMMDEKICKVGAESKPSELFNFITKCKESHERLMRTKSELSSLCNMLGTPDKHLQFMEDTIKKIEEKEKIDSEKDS